jgi:hypothetical protein
MRTLFFVTPTAIFTVLISAVSINAQQVLKSEPPRGGLPAGAVVLVDDGSCPKGKIKEVTGGSNISVTGGQSIKGGARTKRCIPRQ